MSELNVAGLIDKTRAKDNEMEGKQLSFWIADQLFGIPISYVIQIVGMQEITVMPEYPAYIKGVINLRGNIIPVMDARLRLGKPEATYSDRTCIIVVGIYEQSGDFGLIVDGVEEVSNIPSGAISAPPKAADDNTALYLTGVAKLPCFNGQEKIVLLLNPSKIFTNAAG